MPKKGSSIVKLNRLFAIHKLLRTMRSFSATELVSELDAMGFSVNERVVALDIQELRNLGAEIPGHRFIKYCYKKPFSFLEALEGVDTANFNEVLTFLRQYTASSMPKDKLDEILLYFEKMVRNPDLETNPFIQYEKVELKNIEKLDKFYRYITDKRVIDIHYTYFRGETVSKTIVPILLKEYNNRWTLIAFDKEKETYQNFPLDRISNEKLSSQSFSGESSFDPKSYFQDVIGVSVPTDVQKEKIKLKVRKPRANYIDTKSWHHSQILIEESEDFMLFQLNLIPNYEFWAKVMEHFEDIEVLEPESLREQFRQKVKSKYDSLFNK